VTAAEARFSGLAQYLERYASPEVALAAAIEERYWAVLVVPAFGEAPGFIAQYARALETAPGRILVIVVVNAAASAAVAHWPLHRELLESLRGAAPQQLSTAPRAWLASHAACDVLSIDRAHPDSSFPEREGVGLARRIGCDVALALYARGRLQEPWLYNTDADAELPAGYFDGPPPQARIAGAGVVFSFWHVPGGQPAIDAATALYELGLRYYVAGLARAGSPFAFHSLGSAIAVHAQAYAAVRGFPRRLAGEDFYLLNKLIKVAPIWRQDRTTLLLQSRASQRTAHGTGVAAVKLAALLPADLHLGSTPFYHPQVFGLLQIWLRALEDFASSRDLDGARSRMHAAAGQWRAPLEQLSVELGLWPALEQAARHTRSAAALRLRLHTWFDGFRTLKFVHGLRNRALPSLPFREALAASPECCTPEQARDASVDDLRRLLAQRQTRLPPSTGLVFD
jgi:hypothetical protein